MPPPPRPFFFFFFFFPKDVWAHAAWPAAWTRRRKRRRRRRRSRMHSSGTLHHRGPIPCSVTRAFTAASVAGFNVWELARSDTGWISQEVRRSNRVWFKRPKPSDVIKRLSVTKPDLGTRWLREDSNILSQRKWSDTVSIRWSPSAQSAVIQRGDSDQLSTCWHLQKKNLLCFYSALNTKKIKVITFWAAIL